MRGWPQGENAGKADTAVPELSHSHSARETAPLRELAAFFLRLGTTAFGGPAAHVALMEDELVRRRAWLSRDKFLDLLGASNLIPGPSSSELAIHIGYQQAGWRGLLVAGSCFILPAAAMVAALAWAYVHFGRLPAMAALLYGVKPVVIAVILQALWGLGRTAMKTKLLVVIGLFSVALSLYGMHPLLLLLMAGSAMVLVHWLKRMLKEGSLCSLAPLAAIQSLARTFSPIAKGVAGTVAKMVPFGLGALFLVFLKMGAVVFGSGYVLLAFLRADFVTQRGWLTDHQLVDAIAIGQVTPGPVFTTATFIGYVLGGLRGAVVATVGIFLPAFLLVAVSGPLVPRLRQSQLAGAFLDGVNVASLALMAAVTWQLGRASLVDLDTVLLAVASLLALLRFRLNSAWLVLMGGFVGILLHLVRGH
ncbi:MAG: chromate efflux transporter [Acidobacteriia bacterium]|nr:chromate efflux transporter [Terriglobia bacterium]